MRLLKHTIIAALFLWGFVQPYTVSAQESQEKNICREMEQHQAAGADYVPGVDADGNAVVPADLEQQIPAIFDPIIIPVTVDLADRYGLTLPPGVELKPEIAWMEIYRDGRVLYNGEDVQGRIKAACLLENAENPPEQDGQQSPDPLVSGKN